MKLSAKRIPTGEIITISDIVTISESITHDIYYLSGEYDPRTTEKRPLNISIDGINMLKTHYIEFDTKLYCNVKLEPTSNCQ